MQTTQKPPLILTARFDTLSQIFLNTQRERYFPAERNFLDAHLTLFHQLPNEEATCLYLQNLNYHCFDVVTTRLKLLGGGVAYCAESTELNMLHKTLSRHFSEMLTPQDRQGFRPHITIQNKVTPQQARATLTEMGGTFQPFTITITGLDLWAYLGGPWRHETSYPF